MDFNKTIDTVKHKVLLKNLCHYGIRGKINNLFSCYVPKYERTQTKRS